MNYLAMFPDYNAEASDEIFTSLAIIPRQKKKMVQISISVPECDLKAISGFLSGLSYTVSMSNPHSALFLANQVYGDTG
jgi:hypothetical protein